MSVSTPWTPRSPDDDNDNDNKKKRKPKRGLLLKITREFLEQRKRDVEADPSIKETDRWTLSSIWYALRPKFIDVGIIFYDSTRKTVQVDYVREICEKKLGVKRAELGIQAAVRAQLYWNNEVYDVTLKNIDALVEHGTDVLIVEKEGIADVFAPFAAKKGIAILNVRGFLTENADDYSKLVLEKLGGNNVAILHDFDSAGVLIGKQAEDVGIVDLGVDLDLIKELKIPLARVEESYKDTSGHWKHLKTAYPEFKDRDYIKDKRVEIDSLRTEVGVEKLWHAILKRLEKKFPTRDYTRVINVDSILTALTPSSILFDYESTAIDKLNNYITARVEEIADNKKSEFIEELKDYSGIHDVEDLKDSKSEEYTEACRDADQESPDINLVCNPIIRELEQAIEDSTNRQREEIDDLNEQIEELESQVSEKEEEINDIAGAIIERVETGQIIPAIKKLDEEKGYNITEAARLEDEEEEDEEANNM